MIEISNVSFAYQGSESLALDEISLHVDAGECLLLCGKSGCGKSTVLNLINGIIPNHVEGKLEGAVKVNGVEPKNVAIQTLSADVGSVFQNPKSQFFSLNSTDELLFGCCNHKVPKETMLTRLEETTRDFAMPHLLDRYIFDLSGGEKQKLACASAYMIRPTIYVLDEPSANLDANAITELQQVIATLKAAGNTILIAEHRLYYLVELCDRVVYIDAGKVAAEFTQDEFVALDDDERQRLGLRAIQRPIIKNRQPATAIASGDNNNLLTINGMQCFHGKKLAVDIQNLQLPKHQVIALIGHNGAGKSTFAAGLSGILKAKAQIKDEKGLTRKERLKRAYVVMQDVNHQLFAESVLDELMLGHAFNNEEKMSAAKRLLDQLNLLQFSEQHPQSLSGGQKQRTAIATALFTNKRYLIFDEPTSGVDLVHMTRIAELIAALKQRVEIALVITHDREFINHCCDYVVEIDNGKVIDQFSIDREAAGGA
ncbi:MAG: ABC transporter ATP-binding protein [Chloroflexota bacterium]